MPSSSACWHFSARLPYRKSVGIAPLDISVVIKARNEERNLPACLESLLRVEGFKPERLVLVDDGSHDATHAKMMDFAMRKGAIVIAIHHEWTNQAQRDADTQGRRTTPRFFAYDSAMLPPSLENRQRAVAGGTGACAAPCGGIDRWRLHGETGMAKVHPNMLERFALVCGYVDFVPGRRLLFDRIVAVEALLLQVASAAAYRMGKPGGAMGANLAYRVDAYRGSGVIRHWVPASPRMPR